MKLTDDNWILNPSFSKDRERSSDFKGFQETLKVNKKSCKIYRKFFYFKNSKYNFLFFKWDLLFASFNNLRVSTHSKWILCSNKCSIEFFTGKHVFKKIGNASEHVWNAFFKLEEKNISLKEIF